MDLKFLTSSVFILGVAVTALVISVLAYVDLKSAERKARDRHDIHNNNITYVGKPEDFKKVSAATSRTTLGVDEYVTLGTINLPATNVRTDVHLSFRASFETDMTRVRGYDDSFTMNDFSGTPTLYNPHLDLRLLLLIGDKNYTVPARAQLVPNEHGQLSHGISVVFHGVTLTTAATATLQIKILSLSDYAGPGGTPYAQVNSIPVTNNFGDKTCSPPSMALTYNCPT
jgi:hypothetical protein